MLNSTTNSVNLDENLQYLPEEAMDKAYNEEIEAFLEEYKDEIKEMFDFAVDTLELDIQ